MSIGAHPAGSGLARSALIGWLMIGFALGGFFDGIVLHQVLQWHHLLSGLDDPAGSDLRFQIMADGLFHVAMYVLAVTGCVLLVAARARGMRGGTTSQILRLVLTGFGTWHVVDALVAHWLLGLHRIRMDSEAPLVWDIGWLVAFGIVPLLLALVLPRRGGPSRGAAAALMAVVAAAGTLSAIGPRNADARETIVLFRADMPRAAMMEAMIAADARMKWTSASGAIWSVSDLTWAGMIELHARGALVVSTTPVLAGCLAWAGKG